MAKGQENLIPLNQRSKEVQRAIQEMGRQANKEKWQEKKVMQAIAKEIINLPAPKEFEKKIRAYGYGSEITGGVLFMYKVYQHALKGKAQYARMFLELLEELNAENTTTVNNNLPPTINVNFVGDDDNGD